MVARLTVGASECIVGESINGVVAGPTFWMIQALSGGGSGGFLQLCAVRAFSRRS